jgi:hypothetical protein
VIEVNLASFDFEKGSLACVKSLENKSLETDV